MTSARKQRGVRIAFYVRPLFAALHEALLIPCCSEAVRVCVAKRGALVLYR